MTTSIEITESNARKYKSLIVYFYYYDLLLLGFTSHTTNIEHARHFEFETTIINFHDHEHLCFSSLSLVCTPIGFIRLFGVVGKVLVKPNLLRDVVEDFETFQMEEASVIRKIDSNKIKVSINGK